MKERERRKESDRNLRRIRKEEREKRQTVTGLLMNEDIADSFLFLQNG